jgi:hypothetical protein
MSVLSLVGVLALAVLGAGVGWRIAIRRGWF